MTDEEAKIVLDALVKAHVYVLHLPGRMFAPEEGGDCAMYSCFACNAVSGRNHRDDCEVVALEKLLSKARNFATIDNTRSAMNQDCRPVDK